MEVASGAPGRPAAGSAAAVVSLASASTTGDRATPTGFGEVDRVLGGGFVDGSVTLVGGEPGVGKSTLLVQLAASLSGPDRPVLYMAGEESAAQVAARARRVGADGTHVLLAAETDLAAVVATIAEHRPGLVVIDSIQTMVDADLGSAPGSVAQVRHCAQVLTAVAKATGVAMVLVGHVTKDGAVAGPKILEHVVDTVVLFEGDGRDGLRILRAVKHRFGPTGEIGLFEMRESGLVAVESPSETLLGGRRCGVSGSVVAVTREGRRPVLVEIQALVVGTTAPSPRRSTRGLDAPRLAQILAVLERHGGIALSKSDVYCSAVGGVRLVDPGADLALAVALASAADERVVADHVAVCGEVGLAGEIRGIRDPDQRVAEAARLGFTRVVGPLAGARRPPGVEVVVVETVAEALAATGVGAVAAHQPRVGADARQRHRPTRPIG